MQRFPPRRVDVLVVGGGAAGLATGLTLGELGISALVVEHSLQRLKRASERQYQQSRKP